MTDWNIRPFTESDVEVVLRLWATCDGLGSGPGDSVEAVTRFLRRNPELSLVADADDSVVAAVLCGHDGRRGFIYRLAVADAYRRRGIANALVARCLAGLEAQGIPRCLTFVLADNAAALQFWQSMGGEPRPELRLFSLSV